MRRRWTRGGPRDGAIAVLGRAPVPGPIGRSATAYFRRIRQRLRTLFFYFLLLVALGLTFALDTFTRALQLLF